MVIFDFDRTLVDTRPVEYLRARRRWSEVVRSLPDLEPYLGVGDLLDLIESRGICIGIVTSSPNMIPIKAAALYRWPIRPDLCIGPHQVGFLYKPDPAALFHVMDKCRAEPRFTYHVGDQANDTKASRAAGVTAIGAAWGITDATELRNSQPDHLFHAVVDLREFFHKVL